MEQLPYSTLVPGEVALYYAPFLQLGLQQRYFFLGYVVDTFQGRRRRGGGGRGGGARASPLSKVGGGAQVGLCPPSFGQNKCSNFTICSYLVVKNNFFFSKFSWLASLVNCNKSMFSNLC